MSGREHMNYPDLPCWCGGQPASGIPHLNVEMVSALVPVNLDSGGTPLSLHGERLIEIEPGKWVEPLIAEVLKYIQEHPLPEVTE